MDRYESFADCLKRCLKEADLSASEAARLVGYRSRNSIFRILAGNTGPDINLRFLTALHGALGDSWPMERWLALEQSLAMERLGPERYRDNQAFQRVLHGQSGEMPDYRVVHLRPDGGKAEYALADLLDETARSARAEIVITGCCDNGLARLLAERCGAAGDQGRMTIRHYIDTAESVVTSNILGVLPLVGKPWYNARLVAPGSCPEETISLYRVHALHIRRWDEQDAVQGGMIIRLDEKNFASQMMVSGASAAIAVLDRWRFDLDLLKPMPQLDDGVEAFVEYTRQCAWLERDCTICSIKPDVHFNCIPAALLEQAILEGFQQTGMAAGPELNALVDALKRVHDARYANMLEKHKPTHLVYSLPAMERFMRTGVQSDHFFIQRAYTVEERRQIVRGLQEAMISHPWFNVHFLKERAPELCNEITFYDGKGVLLMDAYTNYALSEDHSEAVITLPAFMESFHRYFMDELLVHHVMSRAETLRALEALLVMNIQE